jgi:hypothetical protein
MIPQTCFIDILRTAARAKLITKDPVMPFWIKENAVVMPVVNSINKTLYIKDYYLFQEAREA